MIMKKNMLTNDIKNMISKTNSKDLKELVEHSETTEEFFKLFIKQNIFKLLNYNIEQTNEFIFNNVELLKEKVAIDDTEKNKFIQMKQQREEIKSKSLKQTFLKEELLKITIDCLKHIDSSEEMAKKFIKLYNLGKIHLVFNNEKDELFNYFAEMQRNRIKFD